MIKISKTFWAWQLDKEQEWLEQKAKEGLILKRVSFFTYYFERAEPMDLVYQFDFRVLSKKDKDEYVEMFKEWTLVCQYGSWFYFSKIREGDNRDKIYSDNESYKNMFRRLLIFLGIIGFPLYYQLVIFFPNMESSEFIFPSFYFFHRILVIILVILYSTAVINVLLKYSSFRKHINE